MKSVLMAYVVGLSLAVIAFASVAQAAPHLEEPPAKYEELEVFGRTAETGELVRIRRASCDLFSFSSVWVTPNHAVCAAHCIGLGKRGGSCKGTVCHCRQ